MTDTWIRRGRRRSLAIAGLVTVVVVVGGLLGHTFAADKPPVVAPVAKAPAAASTPAAMPSAPSAMTEAAAKAGVLSCAGRIDQISKFLFAGNDSLSYQFLLPPPPRDQRLVTSAMEIDNKNVPAQYASADFAATAQGCGASYQTVTYWPLTCQDVFTKYFSTVRQVPALGKSIATLDAGGSTRIFLMPAGAAGCVTIKKELL